MNARSEKRAAFSDRRKAEREARRVAILEAAERVISREGFQGASIDTIAREADFAAGTLYLYFKDKDDLCAALFAEKIAEMVEELDVQVAKAPNPLQALKNAVRVHFRFHQKQRAFFDVFVRHRPGAAEMKGRLWERIQTARDRHIGILTAVVQLAQKQGLVRSGNARRYAVALLGLVIHFSREAARTGTALPLNRNVDFVMDLFFHGALVA
jgi:AcrR family transcriptional regulator